jgi:hypothetical protein
VAQAAELRKETRFLMTTTKLRHAELVDRPDCGLGIRFKLPGVEVTRLLSSFISVPSRPLDRMKTRPTAIKALTA